MFLNHVNRNNTIFIFICIFFYYTIFYHILQNVVCKRVSKPNNFFPIANIEHGGDSKLLKTWSNRKKWKNENKKGESVLYNVSKISMNKLGNTFFLFNNPINITTCTNRRKKNSFLIFKKKKDKGDSGANVKKKPKKVFTEEEIEELRRKAKEKLQPKKEDTTTSKGGKRGKKKKSDDTSKDKSKETDENEELEKSDKLKEDEIKTETIEHIKSRDDFEKIVGSTSDIISEKEIEYLHKISNKDDELLNYDKREKHIELNYEDTIFDEGNYMQNYVNNISKFRFDIFNINNKNEFDRITKYLNYEYIEHIPIDIPTDKNYNIELKTYFYEIVCDLIRQNKDRFCHEDMEIDNIENDEKEEDENVYKIEAKKGKINNIDEESDNNKTLNNFLKENKKENRSDENKNYEISSQNDNIMKIIKPTDQDIMNKYMSIDLYNILCDIKEEYDYMFNNGGLAKFSFDENRKVNKEKLIFSGKKKRAIATVFLQKGNNHLIINNRDGYQYLQYQIFNINKIFSPLLHLCMNRNFNVVAHVEGGGLTGQSVAIFHALVKYIVYNFSLKIKPFFRSFKFMTVDSRKVERKKYGLKKARKKKQYSKR